jgi:hypothetical protein
VSLVTGGVYFINECFITLPPESEREVHSTRRRFVVLSGEPYVSDPRWEVVLGCQVSGSTTFNTTLCVKLLAGDLLRGFVDPRDGRKCRWCGNFANGPLRMPVVGVEQYCTT